MPGGGIVHPGDVALALEVFGVGVGEFVDDQEGHLRAGGAWALPDVACRARSWLSPKFRGRVM